MGNRRTANVRSKGYSDLFSLSKDDLWDALAEYPDAKKMLLEKGKQILVKDNMLDEEKARREESSQFTSEEKIRILDRQVAALNTRIGRLANQFSDFSSESLERVSTLEKKTKISTV